MLPDGAGMSVTTLEIQRPWWHRVTVACAAVFLVTLLTAKAGEAGSHDDGFIQLRGAMHIHSDFSTGEESLDTIARRALDHGVDVLVLTDDDVLQVSYGLPFLRNLIGYSETRSALLTNDTIDAYLTEIDRLNAEHESLILIDGVESAPFYFWDIDLASRSWRFVNWNKHLIAVGLESAEEYASLPVIGSDAVWIDQWQGWLSLWPLAGLAYAFVLGSGRRLRIAIGAVSLLCLADIFSGRPLKVAAMDSYSGDLGSAPYQNYIDHVEQRGGMVFWPHPEARSTIEPRSLLGGLMSVASETSPHAQDLVETTGYTGFAALYADQITATDPGREWDQALSQYLTGQRQRPIWGTGDIDYHVNEPGGYIHDILTVFLVRERTRSEVLEAMRGGRMYAVRGGDEALQLLRFEAVTNTGTAVMGGHVLSSGVARIAVEIGRFDGGEDRVHVRLIRGDGDGHTQVVAQVEGITPLEFEHVDAQVDAGEHLYYRLMAASRGSRLTANPIFVSG
jgi:hypothetical protein